MEVKLSVRNNLALKPKQPKVISVEIENSLREREYLRKWQPGMSVTNNGLLDWVKLQYDGRG